MHQTWQLFPLLIMLPMYYSAPKMATQALIAIQKCHRKIEIITMGLYTQLSRSIIISVKIGCFFLLFSVAMQTLM